MNRSLSFRQRRSIRLPEYDYASRGAYFVTVVSHKRMDIFGEIQAEMIILSLIGNIVDECWHAIPNHFPKVNVDQFVVMPNHVHGILIISADVTVGATHESPLRQKPLLQQKQSQQQKRAKGPPPGSLGAIIGLFKSSVTKRVHQIGISSPEQIWQRNYYEHIIRDEQDYQKICEYILSNPSNWEIDKEYSPL